MSTTSIVIIVLIISGFLLIRYASKFIVKLLGFVLFIPAILLIMYLFNFGMFSKNLFARDNLKAKFCLKDESKDVCDCVVMPYCELLEAKFSEEELKEIESKNYESIYVFKQLSTELAVHSTLCSGSEDSSKVLLDKFISGLLPLGISPSESLGKLKEKAEEMGEKKSRKEELDRKIGI